MRPSVLLVWSKLGIVSPDEFSFFSCSFLVVMILAKRLQIALVNKQSPYATMWLDVVNYGGLVPDTRLQTFLAEGLFHQLSWPQVAFPDRQAVPSMVIRA
jgi:hypothetical protein